MIVTFYENSIVKDDYTEVFSPTVFEDYLASLDSDTIILSMSYPTLNGYFDMEYRNDNRVPTVYNYIKFEDQASEMVFYAFINRVDLVGEGLARITYKLDVWHTYIGFCNQRNSIIGNSKELNGQFGYLPIEYETLAPISAQPQMFAPVGYGGKASLIMEFQKYELISSTSTKNYNLDSRRTYLGIIGDFQGLLDSTVKEGADLEEAIQFLLAYSAGENLILYPNGTDPDFPDEGVPMNALNISRDYSETKQYYEITRFYMVPAAWATAIMDLYAMTRTFHMGKPTGEGYDVWLFTEAIISGDTTTYSYPSAEYRRFLSGNVSNDYKNTAIGPFSNPVPIVNNGKSLPIDLAVSIDAFNFNLLFGVQGQNYDITSFYSVDIPFTPVNGETAQLRRIADREKLQNAVAKMVGATVSQVGSGLTGGAGTSSGTPKDVLTSRIGGMMSSTGSYITNIWTNTNAIAAATVEKYQNSYGQSIDIVGAINAYYGLCLFQKTQTYNDAEVQYAIDNAGYETNYLVPADRTPDNPYNLNTGYNPIRYSYINLYGSCPQNIISQLERILTSGVKIWYQANPNV